MKKTAILLFVIAAGILFGVINPGVFGTGATSVVGDGGTISTSLSLEPASDSPDPDAFSFDVHQIERCGTTCGKVTAVLTNEQDRQATNVMVRIRLYAGTSPETRNQIWTGTEQIETMAGHETISVTRQAKLPLSAAKSVQDHGGWVAVRITVDSGEATTIFTGKEQVV